jgi:hypothetical protein
VPFDFDPARCPAIDEADGDYAIWFLDPLTVQQLKKGGVQPLDERAWADDPSAEYDVLLLVGLPAEGSEHVGGARFSVKPTLIPLEMCPPPSTSEPLGPDVRTARLMQGEGPQAVRDIGGMSGGPIFGLRNVGGAMRYFVAGVQSAWYRESRIVKFYGARRFLAAVRAVLREHR